MSHPWLAYLPAHLAADLLVHPDVSPLDRVQQLESVTLFADIAGFTPMSEALGQLGSAGTEELSQILNRAFGAMVALIQSYGGSIGKFAGDALTVIFPYQPRTQRNSIRRAIQCALDIQAALANVSTTMTSAGLFHLSMKIGVGIGTVLTTTVGDPDIRLEYVLVGSAIDCATQAERHATPGKVICADVMLPFVDIQAHAVANGFSEIKRLRRRPSHAPLPTFPSPSPSTIATIARYLPATIAQRLAHDQRDLVDEHRSVTTLFVRFGGFDYQDIMVLQQLQHYLLAVVQIIERYAGALRQVDVGDKGSLYIVLFGAPVSHEDDAERAVLCALDLRTAATAMGIPTATGITTGRIYCGLVGSEIRREYAAIGDAVNLAARLMSAAHWGQILADLATRQAVKAMLTWHDLPPMQVKGKTTSISASSLEHRPQRAATRLRAPGYTLPMVGRQAELERGQSLIRQVIQGQGQIFGITAEAGMGKSRLVAEIMRYASSQSMSYFTSECLSYGTQISYLVWQNLLRGLFDLSPTLSVADQLYQIEGTLRAIDSHLPARLPLLGSLLNLPIPDNDLTRNLEAKLRKESLEALLIDCIRYWARQRPLLLVLEDCHWIDPLSDDLLLAIGQRISDIPLLLLLTHRPWGTEHEETIQAGLRVRMLPSYQVQQLQEFTYAETKQLIELKLVQRFSLSEEVPQQLLERVSERAQGNPFYIDELLNLMNDRGIDPRDPSALETLELPDRLQRLTLSRIDQLQEGPKTALKLASVIGRLFKAHWLWQIYPQLGDGAETNRYLTALYQLDLTLLERTTPELEYLFKHLITREVAYESLALATRAFLHEQVGIFIERTYPHELERWLDVLAYHYGLSANIDKQRYYFRKAADTARISYANVTAIRYYQRVLPLLEGGERVEVLRAMSEIQQHIGQYAEAEKTANAMLMLAEQLGDPVLRADGLWLLSGIWRYMGAFDRALAALEEAHQQFTLVNDRLALVRTLIRISFINYSQSHYREALNNYEIGLRLATEIDDYANICEALNGIGVIHLDQGNYQQAINYFEQALPLAVKHHLVTKVCYLLGNMGTAYTDLGQYTRALEVLKQELDAAVQIGYQEDIAAAVGSMGDVYYRVGMVSQAKTCFLACVGEFGGLHVVRMLVWQLNSLASLTFRQRDIGLAEALIERAVAVARKFDLTYFLVYALYDWAFYDMHQQRYSAALASISEALDLASQRAIRDAQFKARLLAIRLRVLLGQLDISTALAELEHMRDQEQQDHESAAIDYMIWQIDQGRSAERDAAALQYCQLYAHSPNIEYRERYAELTGDELPPPPPLPEPPPFITQYNPSMEALLQQVDLLLAG